MTWLFEAGDRKEKLEYSLNGFLFFVVTFPKFIIVSALFMFINKWKYVPIHRHVTPGKLTYHFLWVNTSIYERL